MPPQWPLWPAHGHCLCPAGWFRDERAGRGPGEAGVASASSVCGPSELVSWQGWGLLACGRSGLGLAWLSLPEYDSALPLSHWPQPVLRARLGHAVRSAVPACGEPPATMSQGPASVPRDGGALGVRVVRPQLCQHLVWGGPLHSGPPGLHCPGLPTSPCLWLCSLPPGLVWRGLCPALPVPSRRCLPPHHWGVSLSTRLHWARL